MRPSAAFRDSYRGLVAEFVAAGEKFVPFTLAFEHDDFDEFLYRLDASARGIDLPASLHIRRIGLCAIKPR